MPDLNDLALTLCSGVSQPQNISMKCQSCWYNRERQLLQLRERETDPLFLQLSQNLITDSLSIYVFCTSYEPKIVC